MTPADVAERAKTDVRPDELAATDLDVELAGVLALAKLFKRPWSYLLIDEPEQFPSAGSDNRTFDNQKTGLSSDLLAELQAADFMLETAAELFPDSAYRVPPVAASGQPPASELASATRSFLGVSVNDQLAVKDEFAALRMWVAAIMPRVSTWRSGGCATTRSAHSAKWSASGPSLWSTPVIRPTRG